MKPPLLLLPAALLVGTVVLVACGDGGGASVAPVGTSPTGEPTTYVVTGVTEGGQKRALVTGSEIRLRLDGKNLGISAGCNSMSGAYVLDGSRLTVSGLGGTDMGCSQPLMDQDAWVARLFDEPVQLTTGKDAALISGGVVLSLADRELVSPDEPLRGTRWLLDSVGSTRPDGAVSSVPQGQVGTVEVVGDEIRFFDGCNGGGGPVTVAGDEITFGDLVTDLRGCTGQVVELQAAFRDVLQGTVEYSIEEGRLTLTGNERMLGFRAVERFPDHG